MAATWMSDRSTKLPSIFKAIFNNLFSNVFSNCHKYSNEFCQQQATLSSEHTLVHRVSWSSYPLPLCKSQSKATHVSIVSHVSNCATSYKGDCTHWLYCWYLYVSRLNQPRTYITNWATSWQTSAKTNITWVIYSIHWNCKTTSLQDG